MKIYFKKQTKLRKQKQNEKRKRKFLRQELDQTIDV